MTRIWAIAANTWREAIRDRIYLALVFFAVLILMSSQVLSPLALGEGGKVTRDFGLSALTLFGVLVTILIGTGMVHKEIERKTIMTLLSKPIGRGEFVLGKFLGLLLTLLLIAAGMLALLLGVLAAREGVLDRAVLLAALLSVGELVLMTAVAIFFSTCASPALSGMFTLAAWVVGHFSTDLKQMADAGAAGGVNWVARGVYYLLPNLELFNARAGASHGVAPGAGQFAVAAVYLVMYGGALLAAAVLIFRRREFR